MEFFCLSSACRFSRLYQLSHCCSLASLESRTWSRGIRVTPLLERDEHLRKRGRPRQWWSVELAITVGTWLLYTVEPSEKTCGSSLQTITLGEKRCIYPTVPFFHEAFQQMVPSSHQIYIWKVHVEPRFCQVAAHEAGLCPYRTGHFMVAAQNARGSKWCIRSIQKSQFWCRLGNNIQTVSKERKKKDK